MREVGPVADGRLQSRRPAWLLLALFALLVGAISCGGSAVEQRTEDADEEQAGVDLEHPSLGSVDAPVVMIEYADYQ